MADNIVDIALKLSIDDSEIAKDLQDATDKVQKSFGKQAGVVNKQFEAIENRAKEIKKAADAVTAAMAKTDTSRGKQKSKPFVTGINDSISDIDALVVKIANLYQQMQAIGKKKIDIDFDKESSENLDKRLANEERLEQIEARRLEINKELKGLSSKISKDNTRLSQMDAGTYTGKMDASELKNRVSYFQQSAEALKSERSALAEEAQTIASENSELSERAKLLDTLANNEELREKYAQEGVSAQADLQDKIEQEAAKIEEINRNMGEIVQKSNLLSDSQNKVTDSVKRTTQAEKEVLTAEQLEAKENLKNARQKASSNYYVLRSLKMLQQQIQQISAALIKIDKLAISVGTRALKMITKLAFGFKTFNKASKSATSSHTGFVGSLKNGFLTVLKYTVGIRSLYILVNKLRSAVVDGLGTLAQASSHVNEQMSSLVSNMSWMKNMMGTVAQPLLNVLVPAIETVANAFERATHAIASFFAALTGQSFVYKAIKPMEDYATSLDKASKSANKAVRSFDKLNVITTKSGSGSGAGAEYETVEVEAAYSELAEKIKNIMSTLFEPLKKAWDKEGSFVMDSWKYALEEVSGLVQSIGRDFLEVWSNDKGVKIWEDIFHIVGDVGQIVGNLAHNFREAWDEGEKGKKIFEGIQSLIEIVISGIREMADYTVEWSKSLDFNPLLEETINLLEALKKPVQFIVDTVKSFWENVVLPFREYVIEKGLPKLMQQIEEIINKIDWEKLTERMNTLMEALGTLLPKIFEALIIIVGDLGDAFASVLNSDVFGDLIGNFKEWADNVKPEDIAQGIERIAKALVELTIGFKVGQAIYSVVQGMYSFTNIINAFNVKKLTDIAVSLGAVEGGAASGGLAGAFATLGSNIQMWIGIIQNSLAVGGTSFTSFTGILGVVAGSIMNFTSFMDMFNNGFSVGSEMLMIFGAALTAVGAIILGAAAWPAVLVAAVVVAVENIIIAINTMPEEFANMINEIGEWFGSLPEKMEEAFNNAIEKVKDFGHDLGVKFGEFLASLPEKIEEFKENLATFIKNVNWPEFGINILKGILYIFSLPFRLLEFVAEAIGNFFVSFVQGIKEGFDMHSPSKKMEEYGENILLGILEGIVNIILGIGEWIKTNVADPIIEGVKGFLNLDTLKEVGGNLVQGLKDGISDKWEKVKETVGGIWQKVTDGAKKVFDTHSPSVVFQDIGGNLVEGMKGGLSGLWDSVSGLFDNLKNQMLSVAGDIQSNLKTIFENISENATTVYDTMKDNVLDRIETLSDTAKILSEGMSKNLKTTYEDMSKNLGKIITTYKDTTIKTFNTLQKGITKVVDLIKSSNIKSFTDLKDTVIQIFDIMKDTLIQTFEGLRDGIKSVINNGIISMIEGMVNKIADGVNTIADAIQSFTSFSFTNPFTKETYSSSGLNLPRMSHISIPRLAQGAVIPPNKEFLAMLGDQSHGTNIEAPLDTIVDAFNQASSNEEELKLLREQNRLLTQILAKNISISSRDIFNSVRSEARSYYNRTGNEAFV